MRLQTENVAQILIRTARRFDQIVSLKIPKSDHKRLMAMSQEEFEQEIKKFEQEVK